MTMSEILASNVGSAVQDGKLRVTFRKTVCLRQYETEVVEADFEVPVTPDDVANRLPYIESLALAKLEYGVMFNLYAAHLITEEQFAERKRQLEDAVTAQKNYCESGFGLNAQATAPVQAPVNG